jgi:hypothetical protein
MKSVAFLIFIPIVLPLVISIIRLFYYDHKLCRLLLEKHPEKWEELTTIPGLGSGFNNLSRSLQFIFSKEDLGDKEILYLKVKYKSSLIFFFLGIIALITALYVTDYMQQQ